MPIRRLAVPGVTTQTPSAPSALPRGEARRGILRPMSGRTVTLVGFMGCGKTTVGRILALRLHWPLKDTDALMEEHEGMKVAEIFRVKGEPYFRDLENRIALSTPDEGNRVLALGGGGFNEATVPHLNRIGPTIHLDLSF